MRSLYATMLLLVATSISAQTAGPGRLLVATDELSEDPGFAESVVLLLEHGDRGSAGLIINRPTWVEPAEAFPELDSVNGRLGPVYLGGPAGHANLSVLLSGAQRPLTGVHRVLQDVYFTNSDGLLALTGDDEMPGQVRLYAGMATWEAGQLDREIERGAWQVAPARSELVFASEPRQLWRQLSQQLAEIVVDTGAERQPARQPAADSLGGGRLSRSALR